LEIGDDYLKKCEQSLSIDSAAAFPAVLQDNGGAYHVEPIFHSSVLYSNLTKPHFDIFIN